MGLRQGAAVTRPVRPYRATYVGATRTVHYDYETKEARKLLEGPRDQAGQGGIPVTVTIRKPLKPGTPVCWVNVFNDPREFTIYGSKEAADEYTLANQRRVACIPVYLPGEGAESPGQQVDNRLAKMAADAREEAKQLRAEVERLTKLNETLGFAMRAGNAQLARDTAENADLRREVERLTNLAKDWETTARVRAEERDAALTESAQLRAKAELRESQLTSALNAAATHKAEVERLKAVLDAEPGRLLGYNEALRLESEVGRLTKELAAAQAQTMPAGKVVYGASGKFGINRDFQTIEFADKRLRDTYRKSDGWTWFTRVEES